MEEKLLPENWVYPLLGEVVKITQGNSKLTKKIYKPDGKYVAFSGTGPDGLVDEYEHEGDAIILSAVGARCGKCFRASGQWTSIANTAIIRPHLKDPSLLSYLFYLLNNENFWPKSGTGQPFVQTGAAQRETRIPLPPLAEQQRIVAKLDELMTRLDAARAKLERVPRLLSHFRRAVLSAACSGALTREWHEENGEASENHVKSIEKLRKKLWMDREQQRGVRQKRAYKSAFLPEEPLDDLPANWETVTVSQLALLDVGFAFKSADFSDSGIRLLRGENIEPGSLRWLQTRYWNASEIEDLKHLLVEEGEIILGMDRPLISSGLKIARAKAEDLPCLLVQRVMRFKMADEQMTDWLFFNLNTQKFIEHLSDGLTGSDLPHVTGTGVAEYTIPLPPLAEQIAIVARVNELFALADSLEARFAKAQAFFERMPNAILAKAFRGELVPGNADDESAAALLERLRANRSHGDGVAASKGGAKAKKPRKARVKATPDLKLDF